MNLQPLFNAACEAAGINPNAREFSHDDLTAVRRSLRAADLCLGHLLGETTVAEFNFILGGDTPPQD